MSARALDCQRSAFDIPDDITYLNAAAWSPLPNVVVEAGRTGAERKARPWEMDHAFVSQQNERARAAAAALIGANPDDVALISSVNYGCATAAQIFPVPAGHRVLLLQDDHTSPMLNWMVRAEADGFEIDIVERRADGDWTSAVCAAIERPGAAPVAIASISSIHWSDGGALDLVPISAALKAAGAGLLVDATHGAGVIDLDVADIDPDFVIFPTYKWLLGPYGRAFAYIAKRHQGGIPLEQTAYGRRDVNSEKDVYFGDLAFRDDARRFDMGERDHIISMEMASLGMELVRSWGTTALQERLRQLTARMAEGLADNAKLVIMDARFRAPHILSVGFRDGMPDGLADSLAHHKVYAAPRLGRLRISPHAYNTEADADRLLEVLNRLV